jgi:probable HAF family extracellular repeat protein
MKPITFRIAIVLVLSSFVLNTGIFASALPGLKKSHTDKVMIPHASYQIIDLGTLGGTQSFALDVNNNRQVSGNSLVLSDPGSTGSLLRAYLWTSGSMTNLGSMAPIPPSTSTNKYARGYAVNDAGVVVGEFNNDTSRAFIYSGGTMTGLTRLAGDNDNGVAHDINSSNVIVGISSNGTASRPTTWTFNGTNYVASDLGTIAGTTTSTGRAWAINNAGIAVGLSQNSGGTSQATRWSGGTATNLGSLGDGTRFGQAYGVNLNGLIVGASSTGQTVGDITGNGSTTSINRAFSWVNGAMTELPPFNLYTSGNTGPTTNYHSEAKDVNDSGLIVGNSQRTASSPAVATLWISGVPVDLNTLIPSGSGWTLLSAEGINAQGDIVGFGTFGGSSRAFMLTRVAATAGVDISGRITTPDGRGLGNARVTMVDADGFARTAITGPFGYYRFDNVGDGTTVVIGVTSKRYGFASRPVQVAGAMSDIDFVGTE